MGKALITNKIYLEGLNDTYLDKIASELTYKIPKPFNPNASRFSKSLPVEIIKNYRLLPNNIVAIPQTREDLIPEDYEIIDKRVQKLCEFPAPRYPLYDNQKVIYDKVYDNVIINASPGWGKTFTALYIACKLKQKTLIIVHTLFLRDQWVSSIKNLLGINCGIISSGIIDHNSPITVANIQTLNKHTSILSKEFGTLILDECLDYESMIDTLEYGKLKLGKIVNQKIKCSALSYNIEKSILEYKPILNYFKNKQEECLHIKTSLGSIKCTNNHNVYTWNNNIISKIRAEQLKVGDYLIQNKLGYKSNNIINIEWESILLGLLLGDGSLQLDNIKSNSCRLKITHGVGQLDYFNWKKDLLKTAGIYTSIGKSGYCESKDVHQMSTKSFIDINRWKLDIYNGTSYKCRITKELSKKLTIESWALLYQDDGSNTENSILFSFCKFDIDTLNYLCDSLTMLFNVTNPVIFTCNKGFNYIRLNKVDSLLFKEKIKHLIHPSMYYKLEGIDISNLKFKFDTPKIPVFNDNFCVRVITSILPDKLTNGYRYNIEVDGNHNYFANGLLVSNCHHLPATTFTTTVNSFHSRYKIGLSGTLKRKDGKHILFKDAFGTNVLVAEGNVMTPKVQILRTEFGTNGDLGWADRITQLLSNTTYQNFIADLAKYYISIGHCVLILADRTEFLDNIGLLIGNKCIVVTGKTKNREQIAEDVLNGKYDVISGSTKIFSEGVSINRLSAVILANPINNDSLLEQIIARAQRNFEGKQEPVVVDINFSGYADAKQNDSRYGFYMRKGWTIETI